MKIGDLIGTLFLARDVAHRVHLSTRSYAKHKELQFFYSEIIPLADRLAETYQGRGYLISSIPLMSAKNTTNIIDFLVSQLAEIEDGRFEACDKSDTALQNIIDEIVELYLGSIGRLKFLA